MEEKRENPDATVNSIRKVVTISLDDCQYILVNKLIKRGWELLRVTDQSYVLGHRSDAETIPQLHVE